MWTPSWTPPAPFTTVVHLYRWGRGVAARLFPLVRRFRLLPLNHAASHDAVEAPQIEESDGAEQPHGDDLSSTLGEMLSRKVQKYFGNASVHHGTTLPAGGLPLWR